MAKPALSAGALSVVHLLHHCAKHLHGDMVKTLPPGIHTAKPAVREQVIKHLATLTEMVGKARQYGHRAALCRRNGDIMPLAQLKFLASLDTKKRTTEELVQMARPTDQEMAAKGTPAQGLPPIPVLPIRPAVVHPCLRIPALRLTWDPMAFGTGPGMGLKQAFG